MKFIKWSFALLSCFTLAGCMGYRVGSTLPADIQTVAVSVVNNTDEPSIEVDVMKSLRAELMQDGRLDVASEENADALLKVMLSDFRLVPLAYDERHGTRTREYRIVLTARAALSDAETGEILLETPVVTAESEFPYFSDLTTAKMSGMPAAADDLARKVVSMTVTAW